MPTVIDPWCFAINRAWRMACRRECRAFEQALGKPEVTQAEVLTRILRQGRNGAFGREHGFDRIRSLDGFRRRVPIRGYEDFRPWIDALLQGETRQLTEDEPRRLMPTSGTGQGRKLIPYTQAFQAEFQRGIKTWMGNLFDAMPGLMNGSAYWSISPPSFPKHHDSALPVGYDNDSAYLGSLFGPLIEKTFAVSPKTAGITDTASFRYATLLQLLRRPDLRIVSVWHPSFFSLLLENLAGFWTELLEDVRSGRSKTGHTWLRHTPMPNRAATLEALDPRHPASLWPNLGLISCWGDAHAAGALAALRRLFPDCPVQAKGLLATEGMLTIPQMRGRQTIHPLAVRSHFFEFLGDTGESLGAHQLREGDCYEVAVTAGNGLYRYRLGDRVRVTGFAKATPCLRFLGRVGVQSDHRGEKLNEAFVAQAMDKAFAALERTPIFAMLAPEELERGLGYTLFAESTVVLPDHLTAELDSLLGENPHYAHCRRLGQLQPIRLCRLPDGTHRRFIEARHGHGLAYGDIKPVTLSDRLDWRAVLLGYDA